MGVGRANREGDEGVTVIKVFICVYENRIMKPIKNWLKGGEVTRKSNRGSEFDQSTYVKTSQ